MSLQKKENMTSLSKTIDHTILKADARKADILRLCEEAKQYDFASVCVNACHAKTVSEALAGSDVKTCCVVGFPLGAMTSTAKAFETREAVENGADEIDMVINIGALRDGEDAFVEADIRAVVEAAKPAIVKVIIETCYLNEDEKKRACALSVRAGAAFVKTSTGFGSGGATVEDVALMRACVGDATQVKAAGGIRTRKDAQAMLAAGADRIGASAGIAIVTAEDE